jgi:hypothetical protein
MVAMVPHSAMGAKQYLPTSSPQCRGFRVDMRAIIVSALVIRCGPVVGPGNNLLSGMCAPVGDSTTAKLSSLECKGMTELPDANRHRRLTHSTDVGDGFYPSNAITLSAFHRNIDSPATPAELPARRHPLTGQFHTAGCLVKTVTTF